MKKLLLIGLLSYIGSTGAYYSYPNVSAKVTHYVCDGLSVETTSEPGKLYLQVSHYTYVLLLKRSDRGALYQNDVLSFVDHGDTATLNINKRVRHCDKQTL
ncbi:MliC family protein [Marinomonas ostreistagni]|uniref:MliC family protein n=1 Tax=Marinomonas ostreistagni TaxID=359209 RepID=UPI0019509649|nr:MliC family protein [Marinomonas ostreistagni]MBM6549504.1 hypothetical protein [Marinomonas ostreistagni]